MSVNASPLVGHVRSASTYRQVGALHLGLAGLVSVAVGAALAVLGLSGDLLFPTFTVVGEYVSAQTLLRDAPALAVVATRVVPVVGVVLAVAGLVAVAAVPGTLRDRELGRPIGAAALVAWNPLALPLSAIAVALFLLDPER